MPKKSAAEKELEAKADAFRNARLMKRAYGGVRTGNSGIVGKGYYPRGFVITQDTLNRRSQTPVDAFFLARNMQSKANRVPLKATIKKAWRGNRQAQKELGEYGRAMQSAMKQGADVLSYGNNHLSKRQKVALNGIASLQQALKAGNFDAKAKRGAERVKRASNLTAERKNAMIERLAHFRRPPGMKRGSDEWKEELAKRRESWKNRGQQAAAV